MAKHGKKYTAALAKVDIDKIYTAHEAVALAKETSFTKFDATIEVHMRTTLDSRQADQQLRDVVVLPHGLGKKVRVLVFATGEGAVAARAAGADLVADDDETMKKIEGGFLDFDVAIATPDGQGWSFGTRAWTSRSDAEPKGGHRCPRFGYGTRYQ
jgi:large subunit ribosomal protein L1